MSRPPQHIRIKRRREDEPVETLYIQSETPQSKRRFTDYVFQRVVRSQEAGLPGRTASAPQSPPKKLRAVSTSHAPNVERSSTGVPLVKTPASIKSQRQKPAPVQVHDQPKRTNDDEKVVVSDASPLPSPSSIPRALSPSKRPSGSGALHKVASISTLRRFHISATAESEEEDASRVLHRVRAGIQKKRGPKSISSRPIIVENISDNAAIKKQSTLSSAAGPGTGHDSEQKVEALTDAMSAQLESKLKSQAAPRKRRVANQAEKNWQAQKKELRHPNHTQPALGQAETSRKSESVRDDPNTWNLDSEALADELSQIALDMTHYNETAGPSSVDKETKTVTQPAVPTHQERDMQALKYQPRKPKTVRTGRRSIEIADDVDAHELEGMGMEGVVRDSVVEKTKEKDGLNKAATATQVLDKSIDPEMDSSDEDYVYDEFIRHSIQDMNGDSRMAHIRNGQWHGNHAEIPKDIGVVVITEEDVQYWDAYAEDDDEEKDWDTEDGDSNAEDNPANEYPDEDLDFDDEENNMTAIYQRFRSNASDDEEYDLNEYDEYGYRTYNGNDDSDEDDTDA